MANLYKSYSKGDIKNRDGGYKALIQFAPVDTFTTVAMPGAAVALGDTKKISDDHVFGAGDGFMSLLCKLHSVTSKGTPVGDEGAQSIEWNFTGIILGDSAMLQEELEGILNDNCIFLLKDQDCINTTELVQFGDECLQPTIKIEFDGKTTKDGMKEYTLTGTIKKKKYWYSGTVTPKP